VCLGPRSSGPSQQSMDEAEADTTEIDWSLLIELIQDRKEEDLCT